LIQFGVRAESAHRCWEKILFFYSSCPESYCALFCVIFHFSFQLLPNLGGGVS